MTMVAKDDYTGLLPDACFLHRIQDATQTSVKVHQGSTGLAGI
jgi:hypothetical protein